MNPENILLDEVHEVSKDFTFEAAHRLPHHGGKCARTHGHSYRMTITLRGSDLATIGPSAGMLQDHADIDVHVRPLLDRYLDHYFLNESTGLENPTVGLREANAFVSQVHRHHGPVKGCKFALSVGEIDDEDGSMHGVAIVGRPLARNLDDGATCEVLRVATDGTKNACSMLYGACARVAREMGYARIVTYVLESETGVSLKAAGWTRDQTANRGGAMVTTFSSSPEAGRHV